MRREILWSAGLFLALFSSRVFAQATSSGVPAAGKDYSFTVPTKQPWTDTGPDLQTGDLVQITSVGISGCGPQPVDDGGSSQETNLPLPSASAGSLIAKL